MNDDLLGAEALVNGLSTLLNVEAGLADALTEHDYAQTHHALVTLLTPEAGLAEILPTESAATHERRSSETGAESDIEAILPTESDSARERRSSETDGERGIAAVLPSEMSGDADRTGFGSSATTPWADGPWLRPGRPVVSEAATFLWELPDEVRLSCRSQPFVVAFQLACLLDGCKADIHTLQALEGTRPPGAMLHRAYALSIELVKALEPCGVQELLDIARSLGVAISAGLYEPGRPYTGDAGSSFLRATVQAMVAAEGFLFGPEDLIHDTFRHLADVVANRRASSAAVVSVAALDVLVQLAFEMTFSGQFDNLAAPHRPRPLPAGRRLELRRLMHDGAGGRVHHLATDSAAVEAEIDAARNDFQGADLSQSLGEMPDMEGVRWSRDTRWPPEWQEAIRDSSVTIGDGLFEVRQGNADVVVGA